MRSQFIASPSHKREVDAYLLSSGSASSLFSLWSVDLYGDEHSLIHFLQFIVEDDLSFLGIYFLSSKCTSHHW